MKEVINYIRRLCVITLLCGLSTAHADLPVDVRADILAKEIITAVKAGQHDVTLAKIDAYRALEKESHKTPPAILFMEAKVAAAAGKHDRSIQALEAYLNVADRSDKNYNEALTLYTGEKENKEAVAARALERRKKEVQSQIPSILQTIQQTMVSIPAGSFKMGSRESYDEKPVHSVTLKTFRMNKYEVTFAQYDVFAADTGRELPDDSGWGRGNHPVTHVNWDDAQAFVLWLNAKTGGRYRLPSEAEWEYACRGGEAGDEYCGSDDLDAVAWHYGNSNSRTQPVGGKRANGFGLYDMSGNVWEWTQDCYNGSYEGAPTNGAAWTSGDGSRRVSRGGSWSYDAAYLRAAYRFWFTTDYRYSYLGFRLAQDL